MVTHEFSDTLASMSDDDIMALVGPATWANGLRLERNGAVKELLWDQSEDHLEARVKDKGLTYRVRIAHGALRPSLACACSLRSDCPHAVAVLIAARAEALESRGAVPEWSRVLERGSHVGAGALPRPPVPAHGPRAGDSADSATPTGTQLGRVLRTLPRLTRGKKPTR